jgi:hypothetical protein
MRSAMLIVTLLALVGGCGNGTYQPPMGAELHNTCPNERPEVCTMEYAPVCAFLEKDQRKEYSNYCNACSDVQVKSYIAGPCQQP